MKKIISKLVIVFILLSLGCNQVTDKLSENVLRKILPPLPEINIGMDKYIVDAEEGGIIKYSSGTLISIPANAFVDKNGSVVKGDVEIQYREMHSLSEIFVSGIPMTYDSAGTEYHFESAGMNEIKGFKNGEPVFINKDKSIDISMKSDKEDSRFNLYYYDTLQNQWINQGKDVAVTVDESDIVEPIEPVLADSEKYSLTIKVDYTEFPELKVFENTIFQLTDSNENKMDPQYTDMLWHNVKIEKGKSKGVYTISFSKYDDKVSFDVNPVYDKDNIDQAIQIYEEKFETYKTLLLAEIEKEKQRKEEEHAEVLKKMYERNEKYTKEDTEQEQQLLQEKKNIARWDSITEQMQRDADEQARNLQRSIDVNSAIYRTYSIRSFGIYNSDCPMGLPKGGLIYASFVDSSGTPLQFSNNITLFQLSNKMIFRYYVGSYKNFRFNPDVSNVLCAATTDGRLAYFTAEDFKKVKKSGEYTFVMRILQYKIESTDDLDVILEIG